MISKKALYIIIFVAINLCGWAQNNSTRHELNVEIPEVALLGLVSEGTGNVNVSAISPREAGNAVNFSNVSSEDVWINYSSIIRNENHQRKITAIVDGELPAGVLLKVEASEAAGNGNGNKGKSLGEVILSNKPTDVISSIGSCYTGKGVNNGHALSYKIEAEDKSTGFSDLSVESRSVNVIYTLTDL